MASVGSVLAAVSCRDAPDSAPAHSASAPAASASTPIPVASDPYPRADDDTQPVYPITRDAPDPRAVAYCDLVHERWEAKRKTCCPSSSFTPFVPTAECVRTLSAALRNGALLLDDGSLATCKSAVEEEAKHCDWGGEVPGACAGILVGARGKGEVCRSNLECTRGLSCFGLGVATPGKCAPPLADGSKCAAAVDSLASFVRQDVERDHPVCAGVCHRGQCAAVLGEGDKCATSLQCGPDGVCGARGTCERAASKAAPLRLGEACTEDAQCKSGACESGKCAVRCGLRIAPSGAPKSSAP